MTDDQIVEARSLATVVPHNITAVDVSPWIVLQYVPALGTGGAAATVAVAAGRDTMTFQVDAADPAGADTIGNTSGELDLSSSTYSTMGKLDDAVNGVQAWRSYLVGAIRADLVSSLLVRTAASAFGANGVTLFSDTSVSKDISIAISGEKFVNNGIAGHVTDADDECENSMQYASVTATSASLAVIRYYTGAQGSTEAQLGQDVDTVTATAKEQGEANLSVDFVTARRGERLIVRAIGVSNTAITVPVVHVLGKTAVLSGDRMVDAINY